MTERERNAAMSSSEVHTESEVVPNTGRDPAGAEVQPGVGYKKEVRREESRNDNDEQVDLLPSNENQELRFRWDRIQTSFVDEPRQSVKEADALVGETIQRLSDTFSQARTRMEQDWDRGDSVSTEDLRTALRRYRSFFTRLLAM